MLNRTTHASEPVGREPVRWSWAHLPLKEIRRRIRRRRGGHCGPRSLAMLYLHYGKKIRTKEIESEIQWVKGSGTHAPELGLHALRQGFEAEIYTALESVCSAWPWNDQRWQFFCENGGKIFYEKHPTPDLLSELLRSGTPLILNLSACPYLKPAYKLVGSRKLFLDLSYHFTVATGLRDGYVALYDPSFGKIDVALMLVVESLREHWTGGTILRITPKTPCR